MHVDFEYICAGIIILIILTVTETSMFNLMTLQLAQIEQEKGYVMAEKILDTLLLSPGDPPNWGDSPNDPFSLGLAVQNSIEAYDLHPSKVMRLSESSEYYISSGKARTILGLSTYYQFSLKITPLFTIDIEPEEDGAFTLTLIDYKRVPTPNANVTGYYVPQSLTPGATYQSQSNISGVDGKCTLDFDSKDDHVFVVSATLLGVKVMKTDPPNLNFKIEGGCVMASDVPLVPAINYSTGSVFGIKKETVFRYVEIEGFAYYVEFNLWS